MVSIGFKTDKLKHSPCDMQVAVGPVLGNEDRIWIKPNDVFGNGASVDAGLVGAGTA